MNYAEIFKMVLETLLMTFISTFLAYLIGLPTGILLNVTSKKGIRPNKTINLINYHKHLCHPLFIFLELVYLFIIKY